jgi:hypothetical protein
MIRIVHLDGARAGATFELDAPQVLLGRDPSCQVPFDPRDDAVSTHHAMITVRSIDLIVTDLGSRNGTFVNGAPVDGAAIVQSEALAQMRSLNLPIPSKVITFSANNRRADIFLDRGLLVSRLPDWTGPLLDLDHCRLRGPHNAENIMAALAVGRVLRLPLEQMAEAVKSYAPAAHRCELVAEIDGVQFVNDSKATNLDAVHKAIQAMPTGAGGEANLWLLAGGKDKGFDYHDIGPLLSQRVKGAFLFGETREKIRAAWSLFTPCTLCETLLEAFAEAAKCALPGDVVLLSPACSSFDQFQNYQHRGEVFRQAVAQWAQASPSAAPRPASASSATTVMAREAQEPDTPAAVSLPRVFLRENPEVKMNLNN